MVVRCGQLYLMGTLLSLYFYLNHIIFVAAVLFLHTCKVQVTAIYVTEAGLQDG